MRSSRIRVVSLVIGGVVVGAGGAIGIASELRSEGGGVRNATHTPTQLLDPPQIDPVSYKFFEPLKNKATGTAFVTYYGKDGDAYVTVDLKAWNTWTGAPDESVPFIQSSSHYAKFVATIANAGAKAGYHLHSVQPMERGGWHHTWAFGNTQPDEFGVNFTHGSWGAGGGWSIPVGYVLLFERVGDGEEPNGGLFGR